MNSLAYQGDGDVGDQSGWIRKKNVICQHSGCVIVHWAHPDGAAYLAVRGTHSHRDALDDIRVFLGRQPKSRISFLEDYIERHCADEIQSKRLFVGGHSLGGMIAMAAAAKWNLPGLVQNAPGWLANPPSPESLDQLIELRTGRDVVGAWGHSVPNTIVLHDPDASKWDLSKLHSRHRQATLVEKYGLTDIRLDDPLLLEHKSSDEIHLHSFSTIGWMRATWLRVDREHGIAQTMAKRGPKSGGRR